MEIIATDIVTFGQKMLDNPEVATVWHSSPAVGTIVKNGLSVEQIALLVRSTRQTVSGFLYQLSRQGGE